MTGRISSINWYKMKGCMFTITYEWTDCEFPVMVQRAGDNFRRKSAGRRCCVLQWRKAASQLSAEQSLFMLRNDSYRD